MLDTVKYQEINFMMDSNFWASGTAYCNLYFARFAIQRSWRLN